MGHTSNQHHCELCYPEQGFLLAARRVEFSGGTSLIPWNKSHSLSADKQVRKGDLPEVWRNLSRTFHHVAGLCFPPDTPAKAGSALKEMQPPAPNPCYLRGDLHAKARIIVRA